MNVGFETIGNATLIVHDGGPVLVTDPWIEGGAYFGSWKLSHVIPPAQREAILGARYVWFSHGHPDHLNVESLPLFREREILLPDHHGDRIRKDLEGQGYQVRVLPDRAWVRLSPRVRVLCIADYNQDAVLLVDVNGRLVVDLNDATERGWGRFVRQVIRAFPESYLLSLQGFGDADMLNYFDESGDRLPLPARAPLGQTIAAQCDDFGVRYYIPFSSMHRYQRTDSTWAAPIAASFADYGFGFESRRAELLPAFVRVDCERHSHLQSIDPEPTSDELHPPEHFGDSWSDVLEKEEVARIDAYFRRIEKLPEQIDFVTVRVGGAEHRIDLGRRTGLGLTLEAPRTSLVASIDWEILDDLLIGNFAKVTLHGAWGHRTLNPVFTPWVAKYGDNGRARSRAELERYFAAYRRRDPAGWARHRVELKVLGPLRAASANAIRETFGPRSRVFRIAKAGYRAMRQIG